MEAKKTSKADLEKKKGLYLEVGLVVVLAITLWAFNVKSYDIEKLQVTQRTAMDEIEETVIQTEQQKPPEPPAPEEPPVEVTEVHIIDNDAKSDNEIGIIDAGSNADMANEVVPKVEVKDEDVEVKEEEVFVFVEQQPAFPGGEEALFKYLHDNIVYPDLARTSNVSGMVTVRFVVEKDGSVSNVTILRDIGCGCGAEAVRVVKSMPKWSPGKQRNKAVRTQFNLPVKFTLQ